MKINTKAAALGFCYMSLGLSPAYADDTDIFLGRVTAGKVKPNVLFILDNSGSMSNATSDTDSTSRINTLKSSMANILDSAQGINAGIMQFNDPGGAVSYPVTDLDAPLVKSWLLNSSVAQSGDDAAQSLATIGGFPGGGDSSVNLNDGALLFGVKPDITSVTTTTYTLADVNDDAEETISSGSVNTGSSQIDMDNSQINGFRFQNINLPNNEKILNSTITFRARQGDSSDVTLRFYAENTANASAFSTNNSDISSRPLTTAYTNWQPSRWRSNNRNNNRAYTSDDISAPIREVINNLLWTSGNSLAIIQTVESSNGQRRAKSRDDSPYTNGAVLNITHQPAGAADEHQRIGLRFQNIEVPRGATITKAYIALVPRTTNAPDAGLLLDIKLEDAANAAPFSTTSGDLTSTSTVSAVVPWLAGDWVQGQTEKTPDLSAQLQQVTNRTDWCGGNDVAFYIEPSAVTNLTRAAYSFDGDPSQQPQLVVEYDPATIPAATCGTTVIKRQISGTPNDAEQDNSGGTVRNGASGNGNSYDMTSSQTNGLYFENLPIAQGATLLEAKITFTSRADNNGSQTLTFKTEDSINAPNFPETNYNITNRTPTSGSVDWSSSSTPALTDWSTDVEYTTPDLKSILQPLVNNASWDPASNSVVFIQTASTSNNRAAYTFDSSPAGAAFLEVKVNLNDVVGSTGNQQTVRTHLKNIVQNMEARTYTPIVDTLYEAARYYRGDDVFWGISRQHNPNPVNNVTYGSQTSDKWKRVSTVESYTGGTRQLPINCSPDNLSSDNCNGEYISGSPKYISPITESCQQNYIVLLTDGLANQNHSAGLIKNYINYSGSCSNNKGSEACSEELVDWLSNNDMSTASVGNNAAGDNYVNTFTIAFSLDDDNAKDYLKGLANAGGGKFYDAGSEAALTDAFNNIIGSIIKQDSSFVVPGTTVSQFNRLSHFEDIYFSVFKPSKNPRWDGNLKKYKISKTTNNYGNIVGMNDQVAINPATGFFNDTVSSFWNSNPIGDPDGPNVTKGGAAFQLPDNPDNRKVYTYYSGASTTLKNNPLDESNLAITTAMLGDTNLSPQERIDLLNWARGEDFFDIDNDGSKTDARKEFGDALHSAPVAVTYGGTAASPDFSVFFATNDGYLHSVNGKTGLEEFAFMPELLLKNIKTLFNNSVTDKHPYGVDGEISTWAKDIDGDGIIEPSDGDYVYIYFGLRRGGSNYYALDVSDRSNPKLMWQIDGNTSPYDELGQSWSKPTLATIQIDISGTPVQKDVLVIGGGYDTDQDNALVKTIDDEGRAIFMVEAGKPSSGTTPALIWSAGKGASHDLNLPGMDYSIPGQIKVGDTTGDGLINVIFAADLGGQVWRFDFDNGQPVNKLATGAVIADIAGSTATNSRRFYAGIDASTIAYKGQRFISLALGSGWRASPLDKTVQDRFYMIKQPLAKPATYTKLTENDLYDATPNLIGNIDPTIAAQAQADLKAKSGWYITLSNGGEKVLSPSFTAQANILFTTYEPDVSSDPCNPTPGQAALYAVNAINATPIIKDDNGNLIRKQVGKNGTIPASPTVYILDDGTTRTISSTQQYKDPFEHNPIKKTFWFDAQ